MKLNKKRLLWQLSHKLWSLLPCLLKCGPLNVVEIFTVVICRHYVVCTFWGFLPYFFSYRLHPVWGFLREPLPFFPGLLSGQGASVGSLLAVLCYWPSEGLEDGPAQSQRDLGKWRVLRPFLAMGSMGHGKKVRAPRSPPLFPPLRDRSDIPDFEFCFYHWTSCGLWHVI